MGLWGFTLPEDSDFWTEVYKEDMNEKEIEVNVPERKVKVDVYGNLKEWKFVLSVMVEQLK